jgi:hypothetical protein
VAVSGAVQGVLQADADGSLYVGTNSNHAVAFVTNSTQKVVISSGGNVGIGTSDPWEQLSVYNTSGDDGAYISARTVDDNQSGIFAMKKTAAGLAWVGVGQENSTHGWRFGSMWGDNLTTRGADIFFYDGSGENSVMTFTPNSRVGIGTATPSHILHITAQGRSTSSSWATSSDRRVKTNIQPLEEGLGIIERLNPVTFEYIDAYKKGKADMDGMQRGFIAQEVQAVIPEMVKIVDEKFDGQEIKDFRLLTNSDFVPLLVKAVQELKAANDNLQKEVEGLRREVRANKAGHP